MKPNLTTLIAAAGAVALWPLCAHTQESRPAAETIKPAEAPPPRGPGERKPEGDSPRQRRGPPPGGAPGHREQARRPEGKPTPFIGIAMRPMSPEVCAQAGLPPGFGVLVGDVMPDSPAKDAGLKQYDVIAMLNDQQIVNMEQLQTLVRARKKGDEVMLTIKRAGEENKISMKIGEKVMPVAPQRPQAGPRGARLGGPPPFGRNHPGPRTAMEGRRPPPFAAHKFREKMRERLGHDRERPSGGHGPRGMKHEDGPPGPDGRPGPRGDRTPGKHPHEGGPGPMMGPHPDRGPSADRQARPGGPPPRMDRDGPEGRHGHGEGRRGPPGFDHGPRPQADRGSHDGPPPPPQARGGERHGPPQPPVNPPAERGRGPGPRDSDQGRPRPDSPPGRSAGAPPPAQAQPGSPRQSL